MRADRDGGGLLGWHLRPLLDQRDATWHEMVSTIQVKIVAYTRFAILAEEAKWAEGVLQLFDLFLELAVQERWLIPVEAQAVRDTGATRFDQGFDSAEVRGSVRIAIGVARTRIMQEYTPTSAEDKAAGDRVLALLERYGNEVEDLLHEGWEARRDELANGSRRVRRFIDDLASGRLHDTAEFSRRTDEVGLDPKGPLGFILLADTSAGADAAARLRDRLPAKVVQHHSTGDTPHCLMVVQMLKDGSAVIEAARASAMQSKTTALVAGPCRGPAECYDRYANAVVLVPHLARLGDGEAVLRSSALTLYGVVATLPPAARRCLRRDVLRGVEANKKILEFLRVSIEVGFVLNAIERATDWDIKTVYDRRDQLEGATGRRYADKVDQTLFTLAYCAAVLDG